MSVAKVKEIIDDEFRTGNGKKGKWSIAKVELDNGKTTNIFMPIEVGEVVESFEKDGYTNWKKADKGAYSRQTASPAPQASNSSDGLRALYKLNLAIYKAISGEDYKAAPASSKPVERVVEDLPPVDSYKKEEFVDGDDYEPDFGG